MKTTKMFAIVALTALSLGMGTAMAQEGGNGDAGAPYWTLARQADALRQMQARSASAIQAGSSDTNTMRSRTNVLPFNGDYSDLANPN